MTVDTTKYHEPAGCHLLGRPHTNPCVNRGREAGVALATVRTVLREAERAMDSLTQHYPDGRLGAQEFADGVAFDDPDLALMRNALRQVVSLLMSWTATGEPTRWVRPGPAEQLVTAGPPEWYEAEVGDEQFMAVQAVLGQVRARLAERFGFNQWLERAVLNVVDEFMREQVEEQRDAEDGDVSDE